MVIVMFVARDCHQVTQKAMLTLVVGDFRKGSFWTSRVVKRLFDWQKFERGCIEIERKECLDCRKGNDLA